MSCRKKMQWCCVVFCFVVLGECGGERKLALRSGQRWGWAAECVRNAGGVGDGGLEARLGGRARKFADSVSQRVNDSLRAKDHSSSVRGP